MIIDDSTVVANHVGTSDPDHVVFDWQHYVPLVPGALRNGARFADQPECCSGFTLPRTEPTRLLQGRKVVIAFLAFAALTAQVGIVRSPNGEQIDFGMGATCMLILPPGLHVNTRMSNEFEVFFDNRQDDPDRRVSGSARVLEDVELQEKNMPIGISQRTYGKAIIYEAGFVGDDLSWYGYEIVIGRQLIKLRGPNRQSLPTPEAIVDACGSAK